MDCVGIVDTSIAVETKDRNRKADEMRTLIVGNVGRKSKMGLIVNFRKFARIRLRSCVFRLCGEMVT